MKPFPSPNKCLVPTTNIVLKIHIYLMTSFLRMKKKNQFFFVS